MRPRVRAKYHVPRVGPIVLTFNEAVNGLTDNSVTVRQINVFDSSPPGPVIPGELVCKKASGVGTSCTEGRVRSATFRPSAAFDQGQYFLVELNPEHSLEATDLAGNPFDRNGVIVTTDNSKNETPDVLTCLVSNRQHACPRRDSRIPCDRRARARRIRR